MSFNEIVTYYHSFNYYSQQLLRRFSDEGLVSLDNPGMRNFDGSSPISARRAHSSMSGHQRVSGIHFNPTYGMGHPSMGPSSRSWHPSPFASDDDVAANEEPQFYKVQMSKQIRKYITRYNRNKTFNLFIQKGVKL